VINADAASSVQVEAGQRFDSLAELLDSSTYRQDGPFVLVHPGRRSAR
jgi:hypothetical protein